MCVVLLGKLSKADDDDRYIVGASEDTDGMVDKRLAGTVHVTVVVKLLRNKVDYELGFHHVEQPVAGEHDELVGVVASTG